jgi:hypothetical protein
MDTPHPANEAGRTTLVAFTWRYLTGHHLDGVNRTNATWLKRGTAPVHHVNWWTEKPRFHRMMWRWLIIALPAGWLAAVHYSPAVEANLTILVTLAFLPYLIHHVTMAFIRRMPVAHMIRVHERVEVPVDSDPVTVNTILDDLSIDDTEELDNVSSLPRKGRSS